MILSSLTRFSFERGHDLRDTRYGKYIFPPFPCTYIMVCTVVLSVVQDRHDYEVWISRAQSARHRHCLITISSFFVTCVLIFIDPPSLIQSPPLPSPPRNLVIQSLIVRSIFFFNLFLKLFCGKEKVFFFAKNFVDLFTKLYGIVC